MRLDRFRMAQEFLFTYVTVKRGVDQTALGMNGQRYRHSFSNEK